MPLADDYFQTPEGMAAAELQIREAIVDLFLQQGLAFGFEARHVHSRLRAPDDIKDWRDMAFIPDPDTVDATDEAKRNLERHFMVQFGNIDSWKLMDLTIRYDMRIYMGFKDVYATAPDDSSLDQLAALVMMFGTALSFNLDLGLDERVSHNYLQGQGSLRFVPTDAEDRASSVADLWLRVTIKVC